MSTELVNVLLLIINGLVALYVIFFKNYLKKKGENQATKEDITEITDKIESVKKLHTQEIEALKSTLDVDAQRKKQLFEDGKQALFDYYTEIQKWLLFSLLLFSELRPEKATTVLGEWRDYHHRIIMNYSILTLLIQEHALRECIDKVHKEFINHFADTGSLVLEFIEVGTKKEIEKVDKKSLEKALKNFELNVREYLHK